MEEHKHKLEYSQTTWHGSVTMSCINCKFIRTEVIEFDSIFV